MIRCSHGMADDTSLIDIMDDIKGHAIEYYEFEKLMERNRTIIRADGGEVPLELIVAVPVENPPHTPYTRVGDIVLLDKNIQDHIGAIGAHPDIIPILKPEMSFLPNSNYTALSIEALRSIDLKGENVLDLGCGYGLLSIISMREGAEGVVGVDYKQSMSQGFYKQCREFNNVDCQFVAGNIKPGRIRRLLNKPPQYIESIPKEDVTVVVANIGPHPQFKDVHIAAIQSLDYLPQVHTYVGGGYYHNPDAKDKHPLDPYMAFEQLQERGFTDIKEVKLYDGRDSGYLLTFIAKRQVGVSK